MKKSTKKQAECPACNQPFVDEKGAFSICRDCPYRQIPKSATPGSFELLCGTECKKPNGTLISRNGFAHCEECPSKNLADEAARKTVGGFQTVRLQNRFPEEYWKRRFIELHREHEILKGKCNDG